MKAVLKAFIWPILAALVALVVCWLAYPDLRDRLRMLGLALQLIGLAMVVVGIWKTRARLRIGPLSGEARMSFSSQANLGTAADRTPEEHFALQGPALNTARAEGSDAALETERRAREASDQVILRRLKEEIERKHPRELIGTLALALGIILATAPNEISCLVR